MRQPKGAAGFIKIADFFNVSLDYLMGRTEIREMNKTPKKKSRQRLEVEVQYPEGLTHEQVIRILMALKNANVILNPQDKD